MKQINVRQFSLPALFLLISGCASTPPGPTVRVIPAPRRPFTVFQDDEIVCKHQAATQVAAEPGETNWTHAGVAGLGTLLGAGLGAAIGGGKGAAIGAAGGLLGGSALGEVSASTSESSTQQRYDNAYAACQYARGNTVLGMPTPPDERSRPRQRP
jgi:hypothetical protein